jgi:competence protein ComEC
MVFSSWIYEDLLREVMESGCEYSLMFDGQELRLSPGVLASVVSAGVAGQDLDINENSALLRISCGSFSVLLTGDIEDDTEMLLTSSTDPVTVLKVPHHGSLSSAFPPYLRRLAPQVAVFSSGRNNQFGHPNPGVVERYREMGSAILRTDTEGTIVVQSDGVVFSVSASQAFYRPGDDIEY